MCLVGQEVNLLNSLKDLFVETSFLRTGERRNITKKCHNNLQDPKSAKLYISIHVHTRSRKKLILVNKTQTLDQFSS